MPKSLATALLKAEDEYHSIDAIKARRATERCPWCASSSTPVNTDPEVANFQYSAPTPEAVHKNPAMCPDCFGVGGWEDFA